MECKNEHFRRNLLFYFCTGKNAVQAAKKLCDVYGEEALKERQCRNWIDKFRFGNFSLKDEQRSGPPNEVDDDQIEAIIESHHHKQHRKLNCMKKRLCCLFGGIGKVWYFLSCFQGTKRLIRMSSVVS